MGSHGKDGLFGADFQPNIDFLFQEEPFLQFEHGNINLQLEPCIENAVPQNEPDQSNSDLLSNGINGDTQHEAVASDQQLEFQHVNGAPPPSTHAQNGIAENGTASTQQPVLFDQNVVLQNGTTSAQQPALFDQNGFLQNGIASTQQPELANGNAAPQNGTALDFQPGPSTQNTTPQNGTALDFQPGSSSQSTVSQMGTASNDQPKRVSNPKKRLSDSSGSDESNKSAKRSTDDIPAPNPENRTREQLQQMVDDRDAELKRLRSNFNKLRRENKTIREHRDKILTFCAGLGLDPNSMATSTPAQKSRPIQPRNSAPYQGQPSVPMPSPGYSNPAFGAQPPLGPQGMWVQLVHQPEQYAQQQGPSTWTVPPHSQQAPPPPGDPRPPVDREHTVPSRPADQEALAQPSAGSSTQRNKGFFGGIKNKPYSWLPADNHMVPGHDIRTSVAEMAKPACNKSDIKGKGKAKNTSQSGNQPPPAPVTASDPAPPPAPVQAPATVEAPIIISSPTPPRQESPVATTPAFMNGSPPPVEEATNTLENGTQNDDAGDNVPRNALGETDEEENERLARQMEEALLESSPEETGDAGAAQEFDPEDHDRDGFRDLFYG